MLSQQVSFIHPAINHGVPSHRARGLIERDFTFDRLIAMRRIASGRGITLGGLCVRRHAVLRYLLQLRMHAWREHLQDGDGQGTGKAILVGLVLRDIGHEHAVVAITNVEDERGSLVNRVYRVGSLSRLTVLAKAF